MIILLTGPTGSGKTDVCWAMLAATGNLVFLDCDWFASRSPFSWNDSRDVESVFQAIRSQIDFHRGMGRSQFIVTLTSQMAQAIHRHFHYFTDLGTPIHGFRLTCGRGVLEARIRARDRLQKEEEIKNSATATASLDTLFSDESLFHRIDTSEISSFETAQTILKTIADSIRPANVVKCVADERHSTNDSP